MVSRPELPPAIGRPLLGLLTGRVEETMAGCGSSHTSPFLRRLHNDLLLGYSLSNIHYVVRIQNFRYGIHCAEIIVGYELVRYLFLQGLRSMETYSISNAPVVENNLI